MQNVDEARKSRIALVAAIGGRTRALGKSGALLWHIPDDMKQFKTLTSGHPVVMGRKTWESLPPKFRPLPGRTNIVVTRQGAYDAPGATVARSLEEALAAGRQAAGGSEIFVIGGGELYFAALPRADCLYLTLVDSDEPGDTFFPEYEAAFRLAQNENATGDPPHRFTVWERR